MAEVWARVGTGSGAVSPPAARVVTAASPQAPASDTAPPVPRSERMAGQVVSVKT